MKRKAVFAIALTFLASLYAGGDAKDEAIKKDRELFEGTWRVVSLTIGGTEIADANKMVIINKADGSWLIQVDGKEVAKGTSIIDPTAKPKAVDLKMTAGASAGKTSLGIYEVDKDSRKVCIAKPEERRPTEFASKAGTELILVTFKREKP